MKTKPLYAPLSAAIALSLLSGCVNSVRWPVSNDWSADPFAEWSADRDDGDWPAPAAPVEFSGTTEDSSGDGTSASALRALLVELRMPPMPPEEFETLARLVQGQIDHLTTKWRDGFGRALDRGAKYRPMMRAELRRHGLPGELAYLPLMESAYRLNAHSGAKARGMWQFIPSTGRSYGLTGKGWRDLRLDPLASSKAAARFLRDLHDYYEGDLLLALAAYNAGQPRINRAIRAADGVDRFVPIRAGLKRETRNYVPRFLATVLMAGNPTAYGIAPPREQGYAYFQLYRHMDLAGLARQTRVSVGGLRELNDDLHGHDRTPPIGNYVLRVPVASADALMARLDAIRWSPSGETSEATRIARAQRPVASAPVRGQVQPAKRADLPSAVTSVQLAVKGAGGGTPIVTDRLGYTVRPGDTLSEIAEWFGTVSVDGIRQANPHLGSGRHLQVGDQLTLVNPTPWPWVDREYRVRRGESLGRIARRFGVSVASLRALNDVDDAIRADQTLRVIHTVRDAGPYQMEYRVRRGNTLSEIGMAFNVAVRDLRRWNGLGRGALRVGQTLLIYPETHLVKHQYSVRRGDALSMIAARLGVEVDHLETVNGLTDPDDIRVGQRLDYYLSVSPSIHTAGRATVRVRNV